MSETTAVDLMLANSLYHHMRCLFYVGGASMYVFVVDIDIYLCIFHIKNKLLRYFLYHVDVYVNAAGNNMCLVCLKHHV